MIRHVVNWKLVPEDADARAAAFDVLADGFGGLPHLIPEIKSLWIGRDLGETAGNWDVVLIVDYESTGALETYQQHPEHQKVAASIRDLISDRVAVDFEL
jgi:hypothetical protein